MPDRRQFLTDVALAGAGLLTLPGRGGAATRRARVVLVHAPRLKIKGAAVDRAHVRRMLAAGLQALAGAKSESAALARWVRPVDQVGLKVNCLAKRQMSTHVELVEALVSLLQRMGLPRKHVLVFDRDDRDLRLGGFPLRSGGDDYRCQGNSSLGYERTLTVMKSGASRFCRAITEKTSVMINLPIVKDHGLAGISGALKNNFGLVHNPNKFHLNGCDPHVAEVNLARKLVQRKQRLIVCDALRIQIDGGPAYHPAGVVAYRSLLLATDPVALDTVLWQIVERERKKKRLRSLSADKRRPVHILTAASRGLGVTDQRRIDLIKLRI